MTTSNLNLLQIKERRVERLKRNPSLRAKKHRTNKTILNLSGLLETPELPLLLSRDER